MDKLVFADGFEYPLEPWEDRAAAMTAAMIRGTGAGQRMGTPSRDLNGSRFVLSGATVKNACSQEPMCFADGMFRGIPVLEGA